MTARTANEQRIESLEAEVVTMREAMEHAINGLAQGDDVVAYNIFAGPLIPALASIRKGGGE